MRYTRRTWCGSWQPVDIVPEEEAERLRGLELRENLVRGMGVAELLYFLLGNRAQGQDTHPWQATALQQYHHQCIDKDKESPQCSGFSSLFRVRALSPLSRSPAHTHVQLRPLANIPRSRLDTSRQGPLMLCALGRPGRRGVRRPIPWTKGRDPSLLPIGLRGVGLPMQLEKASRNESQRAGSVGKGLNHSPPSFSSSQANFSGALPRFPGFCCNGLYGPAGGSLAATKPGPRFELFQRSASLGSLQPELARASFGVCPNPMEAQLSRERGGWFRMKPQEERGSSCGRGC